MLDRAMCHIHIQAAGLSRRQIAARHRTLGRAARPVAQPSAPDAPSSARL